MKTKRTRLAPIAVASLLAGVRQARYNVKRDDSCGAQRSAASINKITVGANASSAQHQMQYFTISTFYLFPRFVHQLQITDSFFIAIFAPNRVG